MSFSYYNSNPDNLELPDCVIRAIQLAMKMPYSEVVMLLKQNADYYNCDELCVCCYERLLDYDFELPHFASMGLSVEQIVEKFSQSTLLIRMNGHITCAINGTIYDLWDCSKEIATDFWLVE